MSSKKGFVQIRMRLKWNRHSVAPAIVIAFVALSPFLNKAFTIDDPLFLFQAKHLLSDPFHPTAFEVVWSVVPERMSKIMPSGPMMAYLLLPCVALGGAEWIAHVMQLLFITLAVVSTSSLALCLGECSGRNASLLLVTTPAVLAMAGTAMPDVPAMAFGVFGVERLVAWRQERRLPQAVLGTLSLSMAILCRSHLILLLGVALLAEVGDFLKRESWSSLRWTSCAPLLACPLVVLAVLFVTRDPQASSMVLAEAARSLSFSEAVPTNLVAYFVHWALAIPLVIPWVLLHPRRVLMRPVLYLAAMAGFLYLRQHDLGRAFFLAPAIGLSAAVLWDVLQDAYVRRDSIQFLLGLWLLVPLSVVPYLHFPSKYLLVSAPAVAILVARSLSVDSSRLRARLILGATLALGLTLGILILRADAVLSNMGRSAAKELIAPNVDRGATVWFGGHWGFQWYAEMSGARPVTLTPPYPNRGDLLVSSGQSGGIPVEALPVLRRIETFTDERPGGRLMSREDGAGFYSNGWGYMPWAWGQQPADWYDLWEVD
ncbi:MAG: hypothetical protein ABR903_05290 [Thermodesulfovibrionales bacterium]